MSDLSVTEALSKVRETVKAIRENDANRERLLAEDDSINYEATLIRSGQVLPPPVLQRHFEEAFDNLKSAILCETPTTKNEKGTKSK